MPLAQPLPAPFTSGGVKFAKSTSWLPKASNLLRSASFQHLSIPAAVSPADVYIWNTGHHSLNNWYWSPHPSCRQPWHRSWHSFIRQSPLQGKTQDIASIYVERSHGHLQIPGSASIRNIEGYKRATTAQRQSFLTRSDGMNTSGPSHHSRHWFAVTLRYLRGRD